MRERFAALVRRWRQVVSDIAAIVLMAVVIALLLAWTLGLLSRLY
jgi:hypothetical protein